MIQVSPHQRLNPSTCPKLIAKVQLAWDKNHDRETTVYKGFAYHVENGNTWTCYQGATRSSEFDSYSDRPIIDRDS